MILKAVQDGKVIESHGADEPVPWWSFTKLLIAAEYWRHGLDLERPYRGRGGPFTFYTIKELLMHRAGLNCYSALPQYHEAVARGDTPWDADRFWAEAKGDELIHPSDTTFAYSNLGYMLLREELDRQDITLPYRTDPIDGYDPRWVAHGLMAGTCEEAALTLDGLAQSDFPGWALADQTRIPGPLPDRPWAMPTYGLGMMGDMGRCFGHTGQGPNSTFACYHFRREGLTIAAYAEGETQGVVEQAVCDLVP